MILLPNFSVVLDSRAAKTVVWEQGGLVMGRIVRWLPRLWGNWLSLSGVVVTTVAGCTLLLALAAKFVSEPGNVYTTAIVFLVVPFLFLVGLTLIPLGIFFERFRRRRHPEGLPDEDSLLAATQSFLGNRVARRRLLFVLILTVLNILLIGGAGTSAISFMNTPEFCGTLCHKIMQPEYEAYLRSPHSRVKCVDCHIGSGASWAVKSKIDGMRQVWAALWDTYSRPVPSPVHELRPARDTCEQCHWPTKFHGNRIVYHLHYKQDETNTAEANVLLLKVGGENPRTGEHEGIHWHVSPDVEIRYEAHDEKREVIGKVTVLKGGEVVKVYDRPAGKDIGAVRETRGMDCVDCHNRPTHRYDGDPGRALDWALQTGLLDPSVPYLRKLAEPILTPVDRPRDGVEGVYRKELEAAYDKEQPASKPDAAALDKAAKGMAELYRRNVFPDMLVGWDTYFSHLGHRGEENDTRGCFRCHDESHQTKDGETLSQDCDLCHVLLAYEEDPESLGDEVKTVLFGE